MHGRATSRPVGGGLGGDVRRLLRLSTRRRVSGTAQVEPFALRRRRFGNSAWCGRPARPCSFTPRPPASWP